MMSKKEMLRSVICDYKAHRDMVKEIHNRMKKNVYTDTRCKVSEKYGSDFQKICKSKFCKICEHHLNKTPDDRKRP